MKSISEKKRKEEAEDRSTWEQDTEFYKRIWEKRKHVCYETGEWLGKEPLTLFFHHILPKEIYSQYRHEEWNVVLVSWETHQLAERDLDKVPKIKELYLNLLNKIKNQ